MTGPPRCPVCGDAVGLGFGRPATYCSTDCRREMGRLRRELGDLEEEVVTSRQRAKDGYTPGAYFWRKWAVLTERQAEALRQRIPEEQQ